MRLRKISLKLGNCFNLSPRYCGEFEVLERIGPVAYRIALLANARARNVLMFLCLRNMYVMGKPTRWEDYLHLVEFAYNNGQQASLGMSPYEALYGRRCRTPVT